MNNTLLIVFSLFAVAASAVIPTVTVGTLTQNADSKRVTIPYTLTAGDACIVTFDVVTNGPSGYASIGGEHLFTAWGDVNRKIAAGGGSKNIYWNPATAGFRCALSDVKAVVNVWPTNNPPDYMVLDLSAYKNHRFYPNAGQIPFGVTNDLYRTDFLVMRKIPAAGITWRMGAGSDESPIATDNTLHLVTLPEDYYLGIYPVTQGQMRRIGYSSVITDFCTYKGLADSDLRPIDGVSWFNIRYSNDWPAGHTFGIYTYFNNFKTYIGGVLLDLPTESQWEYACRAGTKTKYYNGRNDGIADLAWYADNSGSATHPVGTRAPNPWGLYDMIGNVREWCLDYYKPGYGVSDADYDNVTFKGPSSYEPGLCASNNGRVLRGGGHSSNTLDAKSAARNWGPAGATLVNDVGFRVWSPAVYPL